MPSAIDSSATVVKSGERASPRMAYLRSRARCFIVGVRRSAFGVLVLGSQVLGSGFWVLGSGFWVLGSEPVRRYGTGEGWVGRTVRVRRRGRKLMRGGRGARRNGATRCRAPRVRPALRR